MRRGIRKQERISAPVFLHIDLIHTIKVRGLKPPHISIVWNVYRKQCTNRYIPIFKNHEPFSIRKGLYMNKFTPLSLRKGGDVR